MPSVLSQNKTFPSYLRGVLAIVGLGLLLLLGVTAKLSPDPRGLGTHQQLGLRTCLIRETFKIRCPSCGMTTSWAHLTKGNIIGALKANCGGTLLAVIAALGGPLMIISAILGRWWPLAPRLGMAAIFCVLFIGLSLAEWAIRLRGSY